MEAGLHAMDGHLIEKNNQQYILRFLGIRKQVQFVPLPEFFRIKNRQLDFTFPHGADRAIKKLMAAFPDEEKGIRRFFRVILGVKEELLRIPKQRWRQILLLPLYPILYPNTFRTTGLTLGNYLDKWISNDDLKLILQGNLLYYHDDPYTMSMTFFAEAQASFIHHGNYFIKGGSQQLSNALADVIRKNHGTVLLGKKVDRILINKGKAVGVSYRDSFNKNLDPVEVHAHSVIYNGAIPIVEELLPYPVKNRMVRKISKLVPSCALLCVYIGFNREVKSLGNQYYSTFFYGDSVQKLNDIITNNYGEWESKNFVFVDYSQIDSGLAPAGKSFGMICTADILSDWKSLNEKDYRKKKDKIARILIGRLDREIPGIAEAVDFYEVGTPQTISRYTLNPYGAPYGYAQTPNQAGAKRPSYESPVKGLWFAGSWTYPGGGFTGAIVSGFRCGIQVAGKLKKEREISGESVADDPRAVRLVSSEEIARNTLELVFEKPDRFVYEPGQYVFVSINNPLYIEGDMPLRSLSMVSHPDESELRFIVRKSNSSFKKSCEALRAGDRVTIYGPDGAFTLDRLPVGKGLVFLVSGIGVTPVISIFKELKKRRFDGPLFLFYSNRTSEEAAYHDFFMNLDLDNFHYRPVFTGHQPRINESLILEGISDPGLFNYFIVGTSGFLDSMTGILQKNGVPEANIRTDDFG